MIAATRAARNLAKLPATKTIATQQLARGHALEGDESSALQMMDEAEDQYDSEGSAPDSAYFYSPAFLTMQRGLVMFYLRRYADAARLITAGLNGLPPDVRDAEWMDWYRNIAAEALRRREGHVTQVTWPSGV